RPSVLVPSYRAPPAPWRPLPSPPARHPSAAARGEWSSSAPAPTCHRPAPPAWARRGWREGGPAGPARRRRAARAAPPPRGGRPVGGSRGGVAPGPGGRPRPGPGRPGPPRPPAGRAAAWSAGASRAMGLDERLQSLQVAAPDALEHHRAEHFTEATAEPPRELEVFLPGEERAAVDGSVQGELPGAGDPPDVEDADHGALDPLHDLHPVGETERADAGV